MLFRSELPHLPTKVEVSYNDGSRDNQAIGVDWNFNPVVVNTPGVYTITGDLILPDYVSDAGTRSTTLRLTVGDGGTPPAVTVTTEVRCLGRRAVIDVRATNGEPVDLDITLATPYGSRQLDGIEPGAAAFQLFATKQASIAAGQVTVTAVDANGRTAEIVKPYSAITCG